MTRFLAWLQANWPYIAAVVPSIIVGLTKMPHGGQSGDWIKWVLQLFSVLEHSDAPGTFKAPLTARTVRGMAARRPPAAPLVMLLLAYSTLLPLGCSSWWQAKGKAEVTAAAKCMQANLKAQWLDLVKKTLAGDITAVFTVGSDVVTCALEFAAAEAKKPPALASAVAASPAAYGAAAGIFRAELDRREVRR